MTKKTKAPKTTKQPAQASTKRAPGKASSPEQLKIAGTGRIDAIPSIENAAKDFQTKLAAVSVAEVARDDAQKALTKSLIEAKVSEYIYEGKDGVPYCAYVPKKADPKAKVRKIKRQKPDFGDGQA